MGQPVESSLDVTSLAGAVDLRAVARGEDRGLGLVRERAAQGAQSGLELVHGIGEPPAQVERRGGVVDAQCPDCHPRIIKSADFSSTCGTASAPTSPEE